MFYVYVLKSSRDQKNYIGCTSDLRRRLFEHTSGAVQSTKFRRPLKLIYYEAYEFQEAAFCREKRLKNFGQSYAHLIKRLTAGVRLREEESDVRKNAYAKNKTFNKTL